MQLHQLPKNHKRVQRIGRGGTRGTTAGRGTKGQKSRAGSHMRPAERDLIMRIPKRRGFRNKPKRDAAKVFNLGEIGARLKTFAKGNTPLEIDVMVLKTSVLVGKNFKGIVKILGDGEIALPINVKGLQVSAGAKTKIEKAGGSVK